METMPLEADAAPKETSMGELLKVNTPAHEKLLAHLRDRLKASESMMTGLYGRFRTNEAKFQAYVSLPDHEKIAKQMNDEGKPPEIVSVQVPYAFAVALTTCTFMLHTFCGRSPMFQVSSYKVNTNADNGPYMEAMLQFNADYTNLVYVFWQYFLDCEIYGFGAIRNMWVVEKGQKIVWQPNPMMGAAMPGVNSPQPTKIPMIEETIHYEGNKAFNVDPYWFFPDPRVPMKDVAKKGEFVFWRDFSILADLKEAESDGLLFNINDVKETTGWRQQETNRTKKSGGSDLGFRNISDADLKAVKIDQGTCKIVPKDFGLSDSDRVEKWMFSIANDTTIIQAEPLDMMHNEHPVVVGEPLTMGYSFGSLSMLDMIGPIQDSLSWFLNSHMFNVRAVMNDTLIVNPALVELADLKRDVGKPGRIIRLKQSAIAADPRMAVAQLPVQDVTANHITDMQVLRKIGDDLSAVTDNVRGSQELSGRRSATEVRVTGEASASRLSAKAKLHSVMAIRPLALQMISNIQEKQSQEFFLQVAGEPVGIDPVMLAGDFTIPVHDGTLPLDRVAMLDVWKELFMAISQNPQLQMRFDVFGIFEYLATLAGAKNIKQFQVNVQTPQGQQAVAMAAAQMGGQNGPGGPGGPGGPATNPAGGP